MMKYIRFIIRWVFNFVKLMILLHVGAWTLIEIMFSLNWTTDVTHEAHYAQIYNKRFVFLEDGFLERDIRHPLLKGPPFSTYLPNSVEEFLNDPRNGLVVDRNENNKSKQNIKYANKDVAGVIKKGTILKIIKVEDVLYQSINRRVDIIAKIETGEFTGAEVNLIRLVEDNLYFRHINGKEPKFKPLLLKEYSPELIEMPENKDKNSCSVN